MAWGTSRVSGNMAYHAYFWLKRSVCQKIFDPFSQNSTWELGLLKTDLKSFANFFASSHQVNYLLLKKIYGKRNVRVVNNYAETTMTLRISMVNFWRPLTGFKEIFKLTYPKTITYTFVNAKIPCPRTVTREFRTLQSNIFAKTTKFEKTVLACSFEA